MSRNNFSSVRQYRFHFCKSHNILEVLKERMVDKVISGQVQPEDTIVTNARHYHALKEVAKSLTDIKNGLDNKACRRSAGIGYPQCTALFG